MSDRRPPRQPHNAALAAPRRSRPLVRGVVAAVGIASWVWVVFFTVGMIWTVAIDPTPHLVWLYDWHVYAASAKDLAGRRSLSGGALSFPGGRCQSRPTTTLRSPPSGRSRSWPCPTRRPASSGSPEAPCLMASAWWMALWTHPGAAGLGVDRIRAGALFPVRVVPANHPAGKHEQPGPLPWWWASRSRTSASTGRRRVVLLGAGHRHQDLAGRSPGPADPRAKLGLGILVGGDRRRSSPCCRCSGWAST